MAKDIKIIATNRQASRDYHIDKTYEAGLQLHGSEVKSLRNGKANLKGSFAKFEGNELFVYNMHISPYEFSQEDYDPVRRRKLLLHKAQLKQLALGALQKGHTLVPTKAYFKRGFAKIEIAIARGKKLYDKRRSLKEKQVKREISRALYHKSKH